jgi:hypothetical protein
VKARDWLLAGLGGLAFLTALFVTTDDFAKADIIGRLALSIFAAVFFFFVNVRLPAIFRKRRLKRVIVARYLAIKQEILSQIIWAGWQAASSELIDQLSEPAQFRKYFRGNGSADSGWYAVVNGLNDYYVGQLAIRLQMLKTEVESYIVMVDIEDEELLKLMKHLSAFAHSMVHTGSDYESQKTWGKFLFSLFSNWDAGTGYLDEDPTLALLKKL